MNVIVNGVPIGTCGIGQKCKVILDDHLVSGSNTLEIQVYNGAAGWTFSYNVTKNGVSVLSDKCGLAGTIGCMGSEYGSGTVYDVKVNLQN